MAPLASRIDKLSKQLCDFSAPNTDALVRLADDAIDLADELQQGQTGGLSPEVLRAVADAAARLAAISGELEAELRFTGEQRDGAVVRVIGACCLADGCVRTAQQDPSFFSAHPGAFYGCLQLLLGPGCAALADAHPSQLYADMLWVQAVLFSGLLAAVDCGLAGADGFVQQQATPAAVLGWLGAAARAAEAVFPVGYNADKLLSVARLFGQTVATLNQPAFAAHKAALQSSPELAAGVARVLSRGMSAAGVAAALPAERRPDGFSWRDVLHAANALCTTLEDSLRQELRPGRAAADSSSSAGQGSSSVAAATAAGGGRSRTLRNAPEVSAAAWRLLHSVLTLLEHAPDSCPEDMPSHNFAVLLWGLFDLLHLVLRSLEGASISTQQREQAAALLQRAVQRLPQALQRLTADNIVPQAPAALRLCLTAGVVLKVWSGMMERSLGCQPRQLADVPAMCAAVIAALRAAPLAAEMTAERGREVLSLARMATEAAGSVATTCRQLADAQASCPGSVAESAAAAVWKLHSTLCSTAHWLASSGSQLLGDVAAWPAADRHIQALSDCLAAAACLSLQPASVALGGWFEAMSAAHVEAVAVLASAAVRHGMSAHALMAGLYLAPAALLTSRTVEQCLHSGTQRMVVPEDCAATIREFEGCWPDKPSRALAAWLVAAGFLPDVLDHLTRCAAQQEGAWGETTCRLVLQIHELLGAVGTAAASLPPAAAASLPPGAVAQLQQHLAAAGLPSEAKPRAELGRPAAVTALSHLSHALPAACQLAVAVLDWHRQPQQLAAARLEVAQAAVARSCANLRCPNVGLEGGPAAGQGVGCLRCGGCRVAYYCSKACSHPDWRSGHRKVCAELAAARQAQRASQPSQAG